MDEMRANADSPVKEAEEIRSSTANLVLEGTQFEQASPIDKQSIKEIRGIVQTFD